MAEIERIADLLKKRNEIDREISKIIGRPSTRGHIGEFTLSLKRGDIPPRSPLFS